MIPPNPTLKPLDDEEVLVIVWRVTEFCNLGCRFCEFSKDIRRKRDQADSSEVSRFGRVLARYRDEYKVNVMVSWIGGEPFAWIGFNDMSKRFKAEYGLRLSVTTNGTCLETLPNREFVVEYFDEVTVSIDGPHDVHSYMRNTNDASYTRLTSSLKALSQLRNQFDQKLLIRVNTVLTSKNIGRFESFCDGMRLLGIDQISFNQLSGDSESSFFRDNCVSPEQWQDFMSRFLSLRNRLHLDGVKLLGTQPYLHRILSYSRFQPVPIGDCNPGKRYLFVDVDGFIGPCAYTTKDFGINISDIITVASFRALSSKLSFVKQAHMFQACYDCPDTNLFGKFRFAP